MRCLRSTALLSTLIALARTPSPATAPTTPRERTIAANAFAQRTLTFQRSLRLADRAAKRALSARRAAARGCLAAWKSSPLSVRGDLSLIYFEYLSGGLWSVDGPRYAAWIGDLRRSQRIDRSPILARAADALGRDHATADGAYTAFPDARATVTAWRDAGWVATARPPQLTALDALPLEARGRDDTVVTLAGRQLARYAGRSGRVAAAILDAGVDEPDARVNAHSGCDPVGALLFPEEYAAGC